MNSTTKRNVFDRPNLLESQTRLILSADTKPKRLARSAQRSAVTVFARDRSNSAASISIIREFNDDLLDEHSHDEEDSLHQPSIHTKQINYDSDIEPDEEPIRDFSSRAVYLDQCRRYGVIPSTYFLQKLEKQTLDLRFSALKPIQIKVMIPALKINTFITRLDFRANGLGSDGVIHIAELVKENEYLVELNLADNDIGIHGCKALCDVLRTNRTIRRLLLDGNRLNDDCSPFMAELIAQNDYIQYLNLSKNFFESELTGRLLGQALGENQTIEQFFIAYNRLSPKSCANFVKPLVSNARLLVLDISWNGAALQTAKYFTDFLRKNSSLEKLYLNNNQFNTECATHIGRGLAKNETLKYLNVGGNPLESSGGYALLSAFLQNSSSPIERIDMIGISPNQDLQQVIEQLRAVRPSLKVNIYIDQLFKKKTQHIK